MARETAGPNSAGHKESQEPQKQAQNGGRNHETSDWRLTSLQLALLAKPAPIFIRVSIESRNNVPHACESGKGKTINHQTHRPPSQSEDEECDSSTRWSRAVSVLTTKISRFAGRTCLVNQQPTQTRLHFIVNTNVAILRLCDFAARPRRVVSTREILTNKISHGNREAF